MVGLRSAIFFAFFFLLTQLEVCPVHLFERKAGKGVQAKKADLKLVSSSRDWPKWGCSVQRCHHTNVGKVFSVSVLRGVYSGAILK
jgi:hypothetical protein